MRLKANELVALVLIAVAFTMHRPDQHSATPQPIRVTVIEDALRGTKASDDVLAAVRNYADQSQKGRFRCLDFQSSRDRNGQIPTEYAGAFTDFEKSDKSTPRLTITANSTGKTLWVGPLPATADDALKLLKRFGG